MAHATASATDDNLGNRRNSDLIGVAGIEPAIDFDATGKRLARRAATASCWRLREAVPVDAARFRIE